ncbi:hypothetical protein [Roseibium sp.]|uniref:hypothetical protein n=1 Tax=Roseibium sp. TaxID=1936156 RepID=UPI003BAD0435
MDAILKSQISLKPFGWLIGDRRGVLQPDKAKQIGLLLKFQDPQGSDFMSFSKSKSNENIRLHYQINASSVPKNSIIQLQYCKHRSRKDVIDWISVLCVNDNGTVVSSLKKHSRFEQYEREHNFFGTQSYYTEENQDLHIVISLKAQAGCSILSSLVISILGDACMVKESDQANLSQAYSCRAVQNEATNNANKIIELIRSEHYGKARVYLQDLRDREEKWVIWQICSSLIFEKNIPEEIRSLLLSCQLDLYP